MDARPLVVGIDGRELAGKPTGTGRYLRNLLRHWREGGDTLHVYFDGPPPADPVLDHPAIRLRAVGAGGTRGLHWQQRLLPAAARADGLQVFFAPAYSCPLALAVPRVTTVHDLSFFSHPQDFAFLEGLRRRLLVGLSVRVSSALVTVSDFSRRELLARFPARAGRIVAVPHGADDPLVPAARRAEARRRLGVDGPYLITVGAVLNRRCVPELLRASARLLRRQPALVLDIVGDNRTHPRLDLGAQVSALGLDRHVRLSGFVDDAGLADRYAAADAAVFLSEYEGFGLPALEAAARGVPFVTSRDPALGELFAEAALLVAPRDEAEIARALDRVLSDPVLAEQLGRAGRRLAGRYSWAETARLTRRALAEAARS